MGSVTVPLVARNSQGVLAEPMVAGVYELTQPSFSRCVDLSFRSSLVCVPALRSRREVQSFVEPTTYRWRLRALNSAQYRLEKEEREKAKALECGLDGLEEDGDDNELCPVECVREFNSRSEFDEILQQAKAQNSLVVVDFYRTACGSCKYIEKGFIKLCKGAGDSQASVMFLKHNVMDEYEEQSEVAESLKIRVVPLFHFYKDGQLVESFPTREKSKILEAIRKHTGLDWLIDDLDNVSQ